MQACSSLPCMKEIAVKAPRIDEHELRMPDTEALREMTAPAPVEVYE